MLDAAPAGMSASDATRLRLHTALDGGSGLARNGMFATAQLDRQKQ
ncbi:MAG TPA: hypothetical protein VIP05_01145 [Burkholderiaceae bacterium]